MQSNRVQPDTCESRRQPRVCHVRRLPLSSMEECHWRPDVEALKAELERTRDAAKRPPINVEVEECRKFIQRSEKRIQELDAERAAEAVALKEAKDCVQRLEVEQAQQPDPNAHPASSEISSEVQRLQALVAQLQSQLVQVAGPTSMTVDIPSSKRARLRRRFHALCVEEMQQWVWDRQQDLQSATMAGRSRVGGEDLPVDHPRRPRVARSSS